MKKEKEKYDQVPSEMADLAFEFLEAMLSDDTDKYWSMICKADKSRVYGLYRQYVHEHGDVLTFREFIDRNKVDHIKKYEKLRDNSPGITTSLRYSDEGDAVVHLIADVKVPRTYIAPTEVYVYPLTITVDAEYNRGKIEGKLKVRLYEDNEYDQI